MHCLEYCYCLITNIIISVLILFIVVYHHYYHHYHDYYYHHHCHQNCYPHLEYCYLKYYLEYNSGNKLVFIRTLRKFFWPRKWCQPPKTEITSKYEAGPRCTPVDKTEIKKIFCGYSRYITICYLNQQSHRQKFK